MALRSWQRRSARGAQGLARSANQRRWAALNPPLPNLPGQAQGAMGDLVGAYNTAYGEAKSANEARYEQLLGIADQTTQQRGLDVRRDYGQQQAGAMQNLARLGMANTTVAPTLKMGFQREQQSSLNRLADQMQQTKLGIIERKTDAYPDRSGLQQMLQSLSQGYNPSSTFGALSKLQF